MARYDHIIVCGAGRSGTTLVSGLLNALDGYLIRGENYNFPLYLYKAYRALIESEKNAEAFSNTPTSPWYRGRYNAADFIDHCRPVIRSMLLGGKPGAFFNCLGFKEIRWLARDLQGESLADYFDFLRQVMPKLGVIVVTRNLDSILRSGWWPSAVLMEPGVGQEIIDLYQELEHLPDPDRFTIGYEQIIARDERLVELFAFLGERHDPDQINRVLEKKHSF
jgi:hypothetical protein